MFLSHQMENLRTELWKPQIAGLEPDLAFWSRMADRHGDPVLELNAGTGRISLALARAGKAVTAVEPSETMVWEARKKAQRQEVRAEWVCGELGGFRLGRKFSLIIMPNNAICQFLDDTALADCLDRVRAHMAPGGRLVIDAFSPTEEWLAREKQGKRQVIEYLDHNWKGMVAISQSRHSDSRRRVNTIRTFFRFPGRDEELIEEVETRLYFQPELEKALQECGFTVEEKYGDYDRSAVAPDSPKQLLVCA